MTKKPAGQAPAPAPAREVPRVTITTRSGGVKVLPGPETTKEGDDNANH